MQNANGPITLCMLSFRFFISHCFRLSPFALCLLPFSLTGQNTESSAFRDSRSGFQDQAKPTIRAMIGGLFFDEHSYMAESSVHLPIVREGAFGLAYDQHEVTPVFREGAQT